MAIEVLGLGEPWLMQSAKDCGLVVYEVAQLKCVGDECLMLWFLLHHERIVFVNKGGWVEANQST